MKKVSRTDPVSRRVVREGLVEEVAFRPRSEDGGGARGVSTGGGCWGRRGRRGPRLGAVKSFWGPRRHTAGRETQVGTQPPPPRGAQRSRGQDLSRSPHRFIRPTVPRGQWTGETLRPGEPRAMATQTARPQRAQPARGSCCGKVQKSAELPARSDPGTQGGEPGSN